MTDRDGLPITLWCAYWRLLQRYHRYTVEGLEHLDTPGAKLVVGYHGRPLAFDMCMLTVALHDRLGYLPHGIAHRGTDLLPPFKWFIDSLGFVTGDDGSLAAAVARGEHIVTTPGGGEEGMRSFRDRYRVAWGRHTGYLKLALKYDLPVVPVGAAGADDGYIGLNDGPALGRWLGLPKVIEWAPWVGVGPLGLWPFSPPFPVRMHQIVGEPIDLRTECAGRPAGPETLGRLHERVTRAVQTLLDRARGQRPSMAGRT